MATEAQAEIEETSGSAPEESSPQVSPLELSDEDILNMPMPNFEDEEAEATEDTPPADTADNEEDETDGETDSEDTGEEVDDENGDGNGTDQDDVPAEDPDSKESTDSEAAENVADKTEAKIDYEAEFKKLTAPFKANNVDMQIDNVDDAIRMMQMGANYTRKMQDMKPNMKLIKMLQNNDLLSEDKINYLIDLNAKNPDAITKLIKDSGIDPLNVDTEKDSTYVPNNYTVGDKEVELDAVLGDIRGTPTYDDTIDTVSNRWDTSSREAILKEPMIIKVINDQKASGVFDEINSVVTRERMLGRLSGLSDLEAYETVGGQMQAKGEFKAQRAAAKSSEANAPATPAKNKAPDQNLNKRRRAASGNKSSTAKDKLHGVEPLAMSDEEFDKQDWSAFLK